MSALRPKYITEVGKPLFSVGPGPMDITLPDGQIINLDPEAKP